MAVRIAAVGEIVEDRYADFRAFDTPTLIADDFFNAGCVLGAPVTGWRELDLADLRGRMTINGVEVGRTQNMHRGYRFDVRQSLKRGENELVITFASPVRYGT